MNQTTISVPACNFSSRPARRARAWHSWHLLTLFISFFLFSGQAQAQSPVVFTVGVSGMADYPTINMAVMAVEAMAVIAEPYELRLIDASYTEDVTLNLTYTSTNTFTIRPAVGVTTTIIGTLTFGSNSQNVFVNGNNGVVTRALTLRQPSTLLPTIHFNGNASTNHVSEVRILGSNAGATSGVVVLANNVTTSGTGNSLTQSFIGNAAASPLPANLIYAVNAGAGLISNFTLTNNEIFNFTGTGVLVGAGNGNGWTISNNSFYYSAAAVPTTAQTAIDFSPGSTANQVVMNNNFIGGQAAGATGGIWVNSGTQNFRGIALNCGTTVSPPNSLTNNTFSQVSLTGVGSQSFTGMSLNAGRVELSGNAVTSVANTGTGGVNNLLSSATTILNDATFSLGSGQVMVINSGLTTATTNLSNAGIINHTGGDILVNGTFTNASTATFSQTLGNFEVKGDMLNSGLFTCSSGTVLLTGTGNQQASGGLYFNLQVNGGGTKTFTANAEIYNGVQMTTGLLSTGAYTMTLDPLANLVETETSYVLGKVAATRTPSDNITETFGSMGFSLRPAAGSTLPGSTLVTRVTGTAPVGALGRQGILRYFDISATTNSGLNSTMTINYFNHELNGIPVANLRFFKSVDSGANWQFKGVSSAGTSYAQLNGISGFSRWTLGNVAAPLPVGLTAFTAERSGNNAVLSWITASEQENRGFGVEVSLDGQSFREISFVNAQGNGSSTTPHNYRYVDANTGKVGSHFYRLRQEDLGGATHYYGPRLLTFAENAISLAAYPTRFGAGLTVALVNPGTAPALANLCLVDMLGRVAWQQKQMVAAGGGTLQLQPVCAPGYYVLTAVVNGQVLHQQVVRE